MSYSDIRERPRQAHSGAERRARRGLAWGAVIAVALIVLLYAVTLLLGAAYRDDGGYDPPLGADHQPPAFPPGR